MATVQVRLGDELVGILDAAVEKGIYPNRSEAVRDALRRLFASELREEVLLEVMRRSQDASSEFTSQSEIEAEFGI